MPDTVELKPSSGFGEVFDVILKNGSIRRNATWERDKNGIHFVDADGKPIPMDEVSDWINDRNR